MSDAGDTFPVGAIITDGGMGWPWIKAVSGYWFRQGSKRMTWGEVIAWHQDAIDDPQDETTDPFNPVLMLPAIAARNAALEEAAVIAEAQTCPVYATDIEDGYLMAVAASAAAIRAAKVDPQ